MKPRFVAVSVICIMVLSATVTWGQNGLASRNGGQNGGANCLNTATCTSLQPLTDIEKDWLLYMSREERLALNVYLELYDAWDLPIFAQIAVSEKRHVDAIDKLLSRYNLPYSAGDRLDEDFSQLYHSLVIDGFVSVEGALNVGVEIEKKDIADLDLAIADTVKKDIQTVYENLRAGSQNHLSAFESHLAVLPTN